MYRSALRSALRSSPRIANSLRQSAGKAAGRRFVSTTPADRPRSWKSLAVRWGLAIGALYYYNTGMAFAEEPQPNTIGPPAQFSDEDLPTIEAVVAQKRREAEARLQKVASPATPTPTPTVDPLSDDSTAPTAPARAVATNAHEPVADGSPEALEAEADQQGAFNPETGEINWDCPCLGGMAHGPCGEEFKAAFSCFVYSKEEPKGMDCIDKFQHMQDCFRQHPEVYGAELEDDEEADAQAPVEGASEAATQPVAKDEQAERSSVSESSKPTASAPTPAGDVKKSKEVAGSELPAESEHRSSP